ncbi:carbon-phosphorus lyase complex subunit PhnI [Klebsiella pneumoniae]|nr:carbon-phosphorus lyase complex subunit PhnI [Klebsiella pneumoniae]
MAKRRHAQQADGEAKPTPHVFSLLTQQGLAKTEEDHAARRPTMSPAPRRSTPASVPRARLQQMRGDEGYLLALAYSTQRGYSRNHPFAGEIHQRLRRGWKSSRKSWALASILANCC